jgi:Protein of unknown function (DUF2442)
MHYSAVEKLDAVATDVTVSEDSLSVALADGRKIMVPLEWYPRLRHAAAAERRRGA